MGVGGVCDVTHGWSSGTKSDTLSQRGGWKCVTSSEVGLQLSPSLEEREEKRREEKKKETFFSLFLIRFQMM